MSTLAIDPHAARAPVSAAIERDASALAWNDEAELARFTRWTHTANGRRGDSILVVSGMHCAACSVAIEEALRAVPGVESVDVNPATRRARIRWNPLLAQACDLAAAVQRAGYIAYPAAALAAEQARQREQRQMLWRLFVAAFCMMQVMMYAAPAYYADAAELGADIARLLNWASWLLSIPVMVFCAAPFFSGAWRQLRSGRIGMDVPVALGIAVTFIASSGAAFDPTGAFGHAVYFDSLTMFVFFLLCGRYLETRARAATLESLEGLMLRLPETIERVDVDGKSHRVALSQLARGDIVRVLPGQSFPADGALCMGETQVDEALLTGESRPRPRSAGDAVLAGSHNLTSPVHLRVERLGDDTRYAQVVALMDSAASEQPQVSVLADRLAGPFLWGVLVLALGSAAVWWWIDPARSVWVAVSVLIVTCPCALSLATPSALLAAAGTLARSGVLVQRLGALEALASVDLFVFDKTGTLTEQGLRWVGLRCAAGWAETDALRHALPLAAASMHPLSRALVDAVSHDAAALRDVREVVGQGVQGVDVDSRCWRWGSSRFAGLEDNAFSANADDAHSMAWLSVDGRAVGCFSFEEALRDDARAALERLRADGVRIMLLSGDRRAAVWRVAGSAGLLPGDGVHGDASPEEKLRVVQAEQANGHRVAMVGDGMNDGPVLARADVSIAMGQGAPRARAQADITLMSGRIGDLVRARRLAVRTMRVVRQNLVWAAAYNMVCVPLAMAGLLPPWAAGLGMALSSLLVVLNAQRLRRWPVADLPG
jgi:Cu2+-exporting ATPase